MVQVQREGVIAKYSAIQLKRNSDIRCILDIIINKFYVSNSFMWVAVLDSGGTCDTNKILEWLLAIKSALEMQYEGN